MVDIAVPKLNNNDSSYLLVEWLFDDGDQVPADASVAVLETSKATEDLIAPASGVLQRIVPDGTECACGEVIGRLVGNTADSPPASAPPVDAGAERVANTSGTSPLVTAPARELMDELGIDDAELCSLDKKVVKRADIERLADLRGGSGAPANPEGHRLSPNQRAVWNVVSESQRTIPAAFTVVHVDMGQVEESAARLGTMAGATEFVIAAMARLREDFPLFFAAPGETGWVRPAGASHIAVTVDVGKGLFTPVVREAEQLSVTEIADVMMDFRIKAVRDGFRGSDLAGGTALLALNNDAGVVMATPIVFPGNTCAVSLGDTRDELSVDDHGEVRLRRVAAIGVAYDHRIVNGRDAVRFLRTLRERLEHAHELTVSPRDVR
ncbi:2-oxo acid dehydrogenase subunit E2 [Streptomyces sp. SID12501]|uniref:Dihydrolipoamide acetyltransferase component of pyruvate dehydrogenase complex n=1 Tax=Streptomyces sp. SID12501 TaxID=2706042 RepID=A0A6B3C2T1_9ACTN|nr:2-oxo acid dehydrogenase subunit E2 [Streptomyces sp. SID12501]NEC91055.1 pyruvate dehydrogenase [Streptomyces sp. SID12501]